MKSEGNKFLKVWLAEGVANATALPASTTQPPRCPVEGCNAVLKNAFQSPQSHFRRNRTQLLLAMQQDSLITEMSNCVFMLGVSELI